MQNLVKIGKELPM